MDKVFFEVRSGVGTVKRELHQGESDFTDHVEWAYRVVRPHSGWQSVTYKRKRYRLGGGIHTHLFISLLLPIKEKIR